MRTDAAQKHVLFVDTYKNKGRYSTSVSINLSKNMKEKNEGVLFERQMLYILRNYDSLQKKVIKLMQKMKEYDNKYSEIVDMDATLKRRRAELSTLERRISELKAKKKEYLADVKKLGRIKWWQDEAKDKSSPEYQYTDVFGCPV